MHDATCQVHTTASACLLKKAEHDASKSYCKWEEESCFVDFDVDWKIYPLIALVAWAIMGLLQHVIDFLFSIAEKGVM